jgi:hypothetical protein
MFTTMTERLKALLIELENFLRIPQIVCCGDWRTRMSTLKVSTRDKVIWAIGKQSNVTAEDRVVKMKVRKENRSHDTGKTASLNTLIMLLAFTKMANTTTAGRSNWTQNKRGEKEKGCSFGKGVTHFLVKGEHL